MRKYMDLMGLSFVHIIGNNNHENVYISRLIGTYFPKLTSTYLSFLLEYEIVNSIQYDRDMLCHAQRSFFACDITLTGVTAYDLHRN